MLWRQAAESELMPRYVNSRSYCGGKQMPSAPQWTVLQRTALGCRIESWRRRVAPRKTAPQPWQRSADSAAEDITAEDSTAAGCVADGQRRGTRR